MICFVDTHNCESVPQHFWSAATGFVMTSQCQLLSPQFPIISLFIRSVGCRLTSLTFVLSSVARVREQQEQGCSSREDKLGSEGDDDGHQQCPR